MCFQFCLISGNFQYFFHCLKLIYDSRFSFYNDFSGQLLYDSWLYQCFNLFYCSLPIIVYALFDEEYPATLYVELKNPPVSVLETNPALYDIGFESKMFNSCEFWSWILNGTYQSAVLVFVRQINNFDIDLIKFLSIYSFSFFAIEPYFVYYNGAKNYHLLATGMVIFTECVVIANIKILNFSNSFHPFSFFVIIASILFYIMNLYVVNAIDFFDSFGLFPR